MRMLLTMILLTIAATGCLDTTSSEEASEFEALARSGPAIVLSTSSLAVPEGGQAAFTVSLAAEPRSPQQVRLEISPEDHFTVSVVRVRLDASNWDTGREVVVFGREDENAESDTGSVSLSSGASQAVLRLTELDNDGEGSGGGSEDPGDPVTGDHADRVRFLDPADPSATCISCHETEARDMVDSVHYQWRGETRSTSNLEGPAGKLGGMNDFCIYPDINWLGKLTNVDGELVDGGCATCHAGLGERPGDPSDPAETSNVDCLICHAPAYKRTLTETSPGVFAFVPDTAAMTVPVAQAAAEVQRPDRELCLRCHVNSGGGDNFKRGDIEPVLASPPLSHDVHMSPEGADLSCVSCHTTSAHRVAGRGTDLRPVDNPVDLSCRSCHDASPHDRSDLNRHTVRVDCTTCHITSYAKATPTDLLRDYDNTPMLNHKGLYEPWIAFGTDQTPSYRWNNRTSTFYVFGQPVEPQANGYVLMAGPNGSVTDPEARISAFKRHEANQPRDAQGRLLPLKMGILFSTGQVDPAVKAGVEAVGWSYTGHTYQKTERFLGLFHGVGPASSALSCSDCHDSGGGRLDFTALGYHDMKYGSLSSCGNGCHGDESDEWSASELFSKVHDKHVRDKKYDCAACHAFSRN